MMKSLLQSQFDFSFGRIPGFRWTRTTVLKERTRQEFWLLEGRVVVDITGKGVRVGHCDRHLLGPFQVAGRAGATWPLEDVGNKILRSPCVILHPTGKALALFPSRTRGGKVLVAEGALRHAPRRQTHRWLRIPGDLLTRPAWVSYADQGVQAEWLPAELDWVGTRGLMGPLAAFGLAIRAHMPATDTGRRRALKRMTDGEPETIREALRKWGKAVHPVTLAFAVALTIHLASPPEYISRDRAWAMWKLRDDLESIETALSVLIEDGQGRAPWMTWETPLEHLRKRLHHLDLALLKWLAAQPSDWQVEDKHLAGLGRDAAAPWWTEQAFWAKTLPGGKRQGGSTGKLLLVPRGAGLGTAYVVLSRVMQALPLGVNMALRDAQRKESVWSLDSMQTSLKGWPQQASDASEWGIAYRKSGAVSLAWWDGEKHAQEFWHAHKGPDAIVGAARKLRDAAREWMSQVESPFLPEIRRPQIMVESGVSEEEFLAIAVRLNHALIAIDHKKQRLMTSVRGKVLSEARQQFSEAHSLSPRDLKAALEEGLERAADLFSPPARRSMGKPFFALALQCAWAAVTQRSLELQGQLSTAGALKLNELTWTGKDK